MKSNVFATSKEGFSVHFEIEGEKVYKDTLLLCDQLVKDGFTPRGEDQNANGHKVDKGEHWCEAHQTYWKQRVSKDDVVFYSHKIQGTDQWCNEKAAARA